MSDNEIYIALAFMESMHGPGISGPMKDSALESAERIMRKQTDEIERLEADNLSDLCRCADEVRCDMKAEIERLRSVLEDYAAGYPYPDKANEALKEKDDG